MPVQFRGRKGPSTTLALSFVLAPLLLGIVLLAPWLLEIARGTVSDDWAALSDVGDTYAAAAAIISSLALIGVVLSLAVGLRQARIGQQETARGMQFELMRMALEDPRLSTNLPSDADDAQVLAWRRGIYRNMTFMYLRSSYLIEDASESALRFQITNVFRLEEARAWWQSVRPAFVTITNSRRERRFIQIADESLLEARARDTADLPASPDDNTQPVPQSDEATPAEHLT